MVKGIYDAASNLHAKMKNMEIVANNLANINTTGYKREIPFSEYMSKYGNENVKQLSDFSSGVFEETGNKLDLSINGDAFFVVETDRGLALSKDGKFKVDDEGYVVNGRNQKLIGSGGPLNLYEKVFDKTGDISFTKNGEVKIGGISAGQLMIAGVTNKSNMVRGESQNFYLPETDYQIAMEGSFEVMQGYLENSNTNPLQEMQAMIQLNKDYETTQKIIQSLDTMMGQAKEVGKV